MAPRTENALHARGLSVRSRLTLWYALALAAVVLVFSLGVYLLVRADLYRQMDAQLRTHYANVRKEAAKDEADEVEEVEEYTSGVLLSVVRDGKVVYRSRDWTRFGLDQGMKAHAHAVERRHSWSWSGPERHSFRVLAGQETFQGHTFGIAVAQSSDHVSRSLRTLALMFGVGLPGALLLALAGGYALAGRMLRPVGAMAAKAHEITAERLGERLPVGNPGDEFGRLAGAFNEVLGRLEESFERLKRFTSDASHELRTPLTALRSVGEVALQESSSAEQAREAIASMLEESDRLARLVDSLLVLTRGEAGRLQIKREPVELGELAAEVADLLRVLAEEKEQTLRVEAERPVTLPLERATMRQALLNLVDNAIKYSPERSEVLLRVEALQEAGNGAAVIEVIDQGPGIAPEHRGKIFERFYRVDKHRSRQSGGFGLGLAIAEWAVEMNGGRIELDSQQGKGSVFRIVLSANQGGEA